MILITELKLKLKLKLFIKNWNRNGNYVQNWNATATEIISTELNWNWNGNYFRNGNITGPNSAILCSLQNVDPNFQRQTFIDKIIWFYYTEQFEGGFRCGNKSYWWWNIGGWVGAWWRLLTKGEGIWKWSKNWWRNIWMTSQFECNGLHDSLEIKWNITIYFFSVFHMWRLAITTLDKQSCFVT